MGERNLPRTVLQDVGERTLQYSLGPALEAGCVIAKLFAAASGFDPDQSDFLVFQEIRRKCLLRSSRRRRKLRSRLAAFFLLSVSVRALRGR